MWGSVAGWSVKKQLRSKPARFRRTRIHVLGNCRRLTSPCRVCHFSHSLLSKLNRPAHDMIPNHQLLLSDEINGDMDTRRKMETTTKTAATTTKTPLLLFTVRLMVVKDISSNPGQHGPIKGVRRIVSGQEMGESCIISWLHLSCAASPWTTLSYFSLSQYRYHPLFSYRMNLLGVRVVTNIQ